MEFLNLPLEKLSKWIPSKMDDSLEYKMLVKFYITMLGVDFSPIVDLFVKRLRKIDYNFIDGATTSGAVCFFGSIAMSMVQLGYVNNIDEMFTLTTCYILIDHYIDNKDITIKSKANTIKNIKKFIETGDGQDNILKIIGDKYKILIEKIPQAEYYLKKLFEAEVETMKLQRDPNLSKDKYTEIYKWKGGLTCEAIQSIIELPITEHEYYLGGCIQLIDDMMDIDDDLDLGINTLVTFHYKKYNNLDNLISYCIDEVDNMNKKYNTFKIVLLQGLMLSIHINRDKYTKSTIKLLEPHIYFNSDTTKKSLISWFEN